MGESSGEGGRNAARFALFLCPDWLLPSLRLLLELPRRTFTSSLSSSSSSLNPRFCEVELTFLFPPPLPPFFFWGEFWFEPGGVLNCPTAPTS